MHVCQTWKLELDADKQLRSRKATTFLLATNDWTLLGVFIPGDRTLELAGGGSLEYEGVAKAGGGEI